MRTCILFALLGLSLIVLCAGAPQGDGLGSTTPNSIKFGQKSGTTKPNLGKGNKGKTGSNKKPAKNATIKAQPLKRATTTAIPLVKPAASALNGTRKHQKGRANATSAGKPAVSQSQFKNGTHQSQSQGTPGNSSQSQSQSQTQSRVRRQAQDTMNTTANSYGIACDQISDFASALGIKLENNDTGFASALGSVCQSVDRLMKVVSDLMMNRFMPGRHTRPAMNIHLNSTEGMTG